jgi:small subunit ribosomal protein S9
MLMARTKTAKKKPSSIVARGKRKESTARASICEGRGNVRINSVNLEAYQNRYMKEIISEPLHLAADIAPKVDISVSVQGGGSMGQAQAARLAIARALVDYSKDETLKDRMFERDKFLVAEDSRRVEPKKYMGPKARARKQKSYR